MEADGVESGLRAALGSCPSMITRIIIVASYAQPRIGSGHG